MAAKKPADGEFELGAAGAGAQKQETSFSSIRSAGEVEPADLFNPMHYTLHRFNVKRTGMGKMDFEVAIVTEGVMQVVGVSPGGSAERLGLEKDMYLLAVDGKRVNNEKDVQELEQDRTRSHFQVALAKRRLHGLHQDHFTLPEGVERHIRREYLLVRLDPTDKKPVGMGIGEHGNSVYITKVVEGTAGEKAGVKAGDRIVAVDNTVVQNREHCKKLVGDMLGNPFDLIVERVLSRKGVAAVKSTVPAAAAAKEAAKPPSAKEAAKTPPGVKVAHPDTKGKHPAPDISPKGLHTAPKPPQPHAAGEPPTGAPRTPGDVTMYFDTPAKKGKDSVKMLKQPMKKTQGTRDQSAEPKSKSTRAKVDKNVKAPNLKKG